MKNKALLLAELESVQAEIQVIEDMIGSIEIEIEGLKGYLRFKFIKCGKPLCHCMRGGGLHGPYPHLQWWEKGRIKTKYLNKKIYPKVYEQLGKMRYLKALTRELESLKRKENMLMNKLKSIERKQG